jgi:hypothetical protein
MGEKNKKQLGLEALETILEKYRACILLIFECLGVSI